jgi:hypothetical protein
MDHAESWELLGAFALNACDEEELAALNTHLIVCDDCAQDASRLREIAGWLGPATEDSTSEPVGRDHTRLPPHNLRAKILGAVLGPEMETTEPLAPPGERIS